MTDADWSADEETKAARDEQFEPHVGDLLYEVQTLMELRPYLVRLGETGPAILYVACLESCLLHARILIEFVVGRPRGDGRLGRKRPTSDVGADALLPDWDEHLEHVEVDTLDAFRYQFDGHLSHFSRRRSRPDDQVESFVHEINVLCRGLLAFANELVAAESTVGPRLKVAIVSL
jgi:hypothetical protein